MLQYECKCSLSPVSTEAALGQARQETMEAVQQGNHKYAAMLAERMGIEDELKHQLASKQQAALTRYRLSDRRTQTASHEKHQATRHRGIAQ